MWKSNIQIRVIGFLMHAFGSLAPSRWRSSMLKLDGCKSMRALIAARRPFHSMTYMIRSLASISSVRPSVRMHKDTRSVVKDHLLLDRSSSGCMRSKYSDRASGRAPSLLPLPIRPILFPLPCELFSSLPASGEKFAFTPPTYE